MQAAVMYVQAAGIIAQTTRLALRLTRGGSGEPAAWSGVDDRGSNLSAPMTVRSVGIVLALATLVGAASESSSAWAQYDLSTCTGNQDLCIERTRRDGTSAARCQGLYRRCMRTGTVPDLDNPRNDRRIPVEQK